MIVYRVASSLGGVCFLLFGLGAASAWAQPVEDLSTQPLDESAMASTATSAAAGIQIVDITEEDRADARGPALWWNESFAHVDRVIRLPLAQVTGRGRWVFTIDHRTQQPVQENSWHDFLGFDAGGLKIGLGLRYGLYDSLDAGIYRLNGTVELFDVYQIDAKYHLLHQERHHLDLGLRAGLTWFSQEGITDAVGGFGELIFHRRLWDRLTVGAGLGFHSDSSNGVKAATDDDWSLALLTLVDARILSWLAWNAEVAINVAGYGTRDKRNNAGQSLVSYPVWASSFKVITHRHSFMFVVTNSPYTSVDGYVSNSPRGFDELVVGFGITREIGE